MAGKRLADERACDLGLLHAPAPLPHVARILCLPPAYLISLSPHASGCSLSVPSFFPLLQIALDIGDTVRDQNRYLDNMVRSHHGADSALHGAVPLFRSVASRRHRQTTRVHTCGPLSTIGPLSSIAWQGGDMPPVAICIPRAFTPVGPCQLFHGRGVTWTSVGVSCPAHEAGSRN